MSDSKCPVDHSSLPRSGEEACPVDHNTRSSWRSFLPGSFSSNTPPPPAQAQALPGLSGEREISSIPRVDGDKWVYPSEAQFFAAMARKKHDPQAADMRVVVPIHNAVNERAWSEVMQWEAGKGGENCGGVKLVSFQGRPGDMSPRARWRTLIGYTAPFDRHDWIIDRCGTRMRYVIDFYTGKSRTPGGPPSFYLDVRPSFDNWEGVKLRMEKFWDRWFGKVPNSASQEAVRPSGQ